MQVDISICSNERDLKISYGMYNLGKERETARTSVKYIYTDLNDIQRSFIRLGFHLNEFERCKYYEDFGFLSLSEFASANLGMDKSAVSRCISVFKNFAKRNGQYNDGSLTMFIDDKYSGYSYSQLCEMVSIPENERTKIKPDMTIKDIRDFKKKIKNKCFTETDNVSQVATSQPEKCDNSKVCNIHGAALQSFIRSCNCKKNIVLNIFDCDGKPISKFNNVWVELVFQKLDSEPVIYLRTFSKENDN